MDLRATFLAMVVLGLVSVATGCRMETTSQPTTPSPNWTVMENPEAERWSSEGLKAAAHSDSIGSAAVVVVHEGRIVDEWGEVERKFKCHSIRKSFLSALYGISVQRGTIDPSATMGELGIDDRNSLTEQEKTATVRMLLKARSGVYHDALYETPAMEAARPERGSHAPGTHWYYNNWDFNALGTIYEQETDTKIHQASADRIAEPIAMQSYEASDGEYVEGEDSIHPACPFQMTARDMARFGLLFLWDGRWSGTQVVPEFWVKESTVPYSDAEEVGGYGYLWWVSIDGQHFEGIDQVPYGTYTARGAGGHMLAVVPDLDLVLVHRVNTFEDRDIPYAKVGTLLNQVVAAKGSWEDSSNY